jgi:ankyrin repeat protein
MHGLAPNARNNINETPLHNAVIDSNLDEENLRDSALETIRVLLEYGANVSIKNDFGETPIDVANSEDTELIELLKSHL